MKTLKPKRILTDINSMLDSLVIFFANLATTAW